MPTEKTMTTLDEERILEYVEKKGSINNTQCRQLLKVEYDRASYLLRKMNRTGRLAREGRQRAIFYRLP